MTTVRIPADVDLEDRLIGRLTAHQLGIVVGAVAAVYAVWALIGRHLPLAVFVVGAALVAVVVIVAVFGRRDGISLDRFVMAATRQQVGSRPIRPALSVAGVPGWIAGPATRAPHGRGDGTRIPVAAPIPAGQITDTGVIDLGASGLVVIATATTVQMGWLDEREQLRLLATIAGYLHSLAAPVQILTRAVPVDLSGHVDALYRAAAALPDAVAGPATDHAAFLSDLSTGTGLLRRQVLLVLREPRHGVPAVRSRRWACLPRTSGSASSRSASSRSSGSLSWAEADVRLARRLGEAVDLLGAAGVTVTPLGPVEVAAVLADACNPARRITAPPADPDHIITGTYR